MFLRIKYLVASDGDRLTLDEDLEFEHDVEFFLIL